MRNLCLNENDFNDFKAIVDCMIFLFVSSICCGKSNKFLYYFTKFADETNMFG